MIKHYYKSALFVSDPPHSRRILFLAKFLNSYDDANLSYSVVGTDVDWWDREHYYRDRDARTFVLSEMIKLAHNFIAYGVLQKYGLLETAKEKFGPLIRFFKTKIYYNFVETDECKCPE